MRSRVTAGQSGLWTAIPPSAAIIVFTTTVSHTFGRATYGLLLSSIEADLGISHTTAGFGSTVIFGSYLIGLVLVAAVAPRAEPINIMRAGLLSGVVGLATMAVAPTFPLVLAGLAFAAGAGAGIWITAPLLATEGVAANRRGFVIGMLSSTIGLGTFVVSVGLGVIRSATGNPLTWRPIWAGEAAFTALLLVLAVAFVRPAKTEQLRGGFSMQRLKAVPGWAAITAGYAMFGLIIAGLQTFIVVALEEDAGLTQGQASVVWGLMGIGGIFSAPSLGLLSDRLGRRPLIVTIMLLIGLGSFVLAVGRGWIVAGAVILIGMMWGALPAMVAAHVRDHVDARAFSAVFATMTLVYSIFAIGAGPLVGFLADETGSFAVSFLLLTAVSALAAGAFSRLPSN